MSQTSYIFILIIGALVILAVLAYNIYRENQYRQKLREQFGHADADALLNAAAAQSRDARPDKLVSSRAAPAFERTQTTPATTSAPSVAPTPDFSDKDPVPAPFRQPQSPVEHEPEPTPVFTSTPAAQAALNLNDLQQMSLPWFDKRFDYLAYLSLARPQELHHIPRLSNRSRFRIIGCTLDGRFQPAEPIPSVYYQGFVIGLQAISRSGLAQRAELEEFAQQTREFAQALDADIKLEEIEEFFTVAQPLDALCARVDQTIGIHLVSRETLSGAELNQALTQHGFELSHDGAFHTWQNNGETLFSIVTLDGKPFTPQLLEAQQYRGFTMLFDMPHIPGGEKTFNQFMDLAVKLSSQLSLDLVDDKLHELSTQWLKDIRTYVLARQEEMKSVGLDAGSELAHRIFS